MNRLFFNGVKFFTLVFIYSVSFISCNNDDEVLLSEGQSELFTKGAFEPETVFSHGDPTHELIIDAQTVTFTLAPPKEDGTSPQLRTAGNMVGPLPVSTPKRVTTGKYKKYFTKISDFNWLPSYSYVLLRLDEYRFEINLPKTAFQGAYILYPQTTEGFATNGANYRGYSHVSTVSHATGHKITFKFFIQNGAAYNILGQRLSANTSIPIKGENVRYNYKYMLAQ
jgi:hypothetical protein